MEVGEVGAVKGDKPQVHADKVLPAGSVKEFTEALGRSAGSRAQAGAVTEIDDPASVVGADATNPFGGKAIETITRGSNVTDKDLSFTPGARVTGSGWDVFEGGMNVPRLREFAKTPGVGEPSGPRQIPAGLTVNDTSMSTSMQWSPGSTRADDTAGHRGKGGVRDVFEGRMNIPGSREFAKAPGVGEPSVSRRSSTELAVNATPTSAQRQLSSDSSGVDDVAGNERKGAAAAGEETASTVKRPLGRDTPAANASGGDAADTDRMRKPGSGDIPASGDNVSMKKHGALDVAKMLPNASGDGADADRMRKPGSGDIPASGDNVRPKKVGALDVAKMLPDASGGAESRIGANAAVPAKSVDQVVDAYTQGRPPAEIENSISVSDIARMQERFRRELQKKGHAPEIADRISDDQYRRMAIAEDIYRHYYQPAVDKPQPTIGEAQLNAQPDRYDGRTQLPDGRLLRVNEFVLGTPAGGGWVNADQPHPVDRFDLNMWVDHAPEPVDHVAGEPNKRRVELQLRFASGFDVSARADSGPVYAQGRAFEAARDVMSSDRHLQPEAIAEGSPAFKKPVRKGVYATEEKDLPQDGLLQEGLPIVYPEALGFGIVQLNLTAAAINQGVVSAPVAQARMLALGAKPQTAGFDPDRPWQEPAPGPGGPARNEAVSGDAGDDSNGSGDHRRDQRRHRKPGSRQAGNRSSSELDGAEL